MIKRTAVFIFLSVFLTSCLNYTQITTIKTDGSGEMFIHYWMNWNSSEDSVWLKKLHIFNEDSIRSEFSSPFVSINRTGTFINYEDSTIHTQIEMDFGNFDSLRNVKAFGGANFSLTDGASGTKIFSQFIPPFPFGFGIKGRQFDFKIVYYLPGEILNHNAVEKSRNKLTWNFNLSEIGRGKTLKAVYRPYKLKETPLWVYVSTFVVIFIVIVFLFKKRK